METHRVRRLRWRASAANPAEAFTLRTLLREQGEACEAALDRAFDKAVPPHEVWHLPRLALDVRIADLHGVSAGELAERIEAAVRAALAAADRPAAADVHAREGARAASSRASPDVPMFPPTGTASPHRSTAVEARQALRHYMATGLLPWTLAGLAPEQAQRVLAEAAVQAAESVSGGSEALNVLLPGSGDTRAAVGALLRWLPLLPAVLRRRLLAAHRPQLALSPVVRQGWLAWIDDDAIDRIEWQALWLAAPSDIATLRELVAQHHAVVAAPPFLPALREALEDKKPGRRATRPASPTIKGETAPAQTQEPPQPPKPPARQAEADTAPTTEPLLVPLAGLVLLHPWLPRMLAARGVLDESGKQIAPAELPRACALLHALACGDAPIAEHQLPLVKLLLGRPPDAPLTAALPALSPEDREEVDALLTAVRDHWSALRGTGVDGLRLSFLQRRGLLSRGDDAWHLRMQSEAFDMLMGMLPWRIEQLRLPWMPKPLMVEWPTP
jgi:hypothetical protein